MLTLLMSNFWREHARANLPGFAGPLLVDESAGCTVWDRGTSRSSGEPVELRTNGEIEAAGCWEGSEGEESDEERGDCTPAWSPSEAAAAASAASADILAPRTEALAPGCSVQKSWVSQVAAASW